MRPSLAALALVVGTTSAGHLSVPLSRQGYNVHIPPSISRRQSNVSDSSIILQAVNNMTGGGYYAEFGVGTPPQDIGFLLDTGSSDTWVNSADSNLCNSEHLQTYLGHCLKPCTSSHVSRARHSGLIPKALCTDQDVLSSRPR